MLHRATRYVYQRQKAQNYISSVLVSLLPCHVLYLAFPLKYATQRDSDTSPSMPCVAPLPPILGCFSPELVRCGTAAYQQRLASIGVDLPQLARDRVTGTVRTLHTNTYNCTVQYALSVSSGFAYLKSEPVNCCEDLVRREHCKPA